MTVNYYEVLHQIHEGYVNYCKNSPEDDRGFDHYVEVAWSHGMPNTIEDLVCEIYLFRKKFGQLESDV